MDAVLPQPGLLFTLGTYLLMIGILVVVHEGGHYIAGRIFRVRIDAFALGFGRELFGFNDRRGTRWRLNAVPLGGYVKFTGDMNAAGLTSPEVLALPPSERAGLFAFAPLWQRAIIVAAGPLINFIFAIAILAGFYMAIGHPVTPPVVALVQPGSPAAAAGIRNGDRIVSLDGSSVSRFEDIVSAVYINTGQPMTVVIVRDGATRTLSVTPKIVEMRDRFGGVSTRGMLGVGRSAQVIEPVGPLDAVALGTRDTGEIIASIATTLKQVVIGQRSLGELGGPIKAGAITGQQASLGVLPFIMFMAFFSINLGFINLIPIPMLDGGHLFLYAVEAFRRRPLGQRVQEWAFMSGFAAVMSLMVILTWNDLGSVGVFKRLAGWLG